MSQITQVSAAQAFIQKRRYDVALWLSVLFLALILLLAIFADWLGLADPNRGSLIARLKPVGTPGHVLGTDELGRDMLSRLIYGARMTPVMGIVPIAIAMAVATLLGTLAGLMGGLVNAMIMRTIDVFFAFPSVLLAIAVAGALGAGVENIILSLVIVFVPPLTRVAESAATSIRSLDYLQAARTSGAGPFDIIFFHVLPNVFWPIFGFATSQISIAMIIASGLSFLGMGVSPPTAEWGLMLNALKSAIYVDPLLAILPGIMIFLVSLALNVVSDRIRRNSNV